MELFRSGGTAAQSRLIDELNLYEKLGKDAIVRLSTSFYDRVYADEQAWFRELFASSAKEDAIRNQWEWLVQRLGGPPLYSERRGHPGLMRSHRHFAVTEAAADRWLEHMESALEEAIDEADSRQRLYYFLRHMAYFLAEGLSKPGGPAHPHAARHAEQLASARAGSAERYVGSSGLSTQLSSVSSVEMRIGEAKVALMAALSPEHMEVVWEDAGADADEPHFDVLVVAPQFEHMALLERQRTVLQVVTPPLSESSRSDPTISIRAKTPRQWEAWCLTGSWSTGGDGVA
jgi:truncated hemoglobin YjbI/stress-induced morphogen